MVPFFFFIVPQALKLLFSNIITLSRAHYFSFLAVPAGQRTCTCMGWLMAEVPVCNCPDRGCDGAVILFLGKQKNVSGGNSLAAVGNGGVASVQQHVGDFGFVFHLKQLNLNSVKCC